MSRPARTFTVRHVQLARALFAALAALMITFSSDHSAHVGLAVFSGFAVATGLIFAVAAWLVADTGERGILALLAGISLVAGIAGGVPTWRSTTLFFVLVIVWAAGTGLVELLAGIQDRRRAASDTTAVSPVAAASARDGLLIGAVTLLLALALLVVPAGYAWEYTIEGAGEFTLTGIILGVGIFGAYAAIVAVFLGIAGFSPRTEATAPLAPGEAKDNGGLA